MNLIFFKLAQTLAVLVGWALFSIAAIVGAPVFLAWSSASVLADVWAFKPKKP